MTLIKEAERGMPERWSAQRKTELVVRLFRCEALDAVSRESQVPGQDIVVALER